MRFIYTLLLAVFSGVLAATAILTLLLLWLGAPISAAEILHSTCLSAFLATLATIFWFAGPNDSLGAKIFCGLIVPVGGAVDSAFIMLVLKSGRLAWPDHAELFLAFYAGWALAASVPALAVCYLIQNRKFKKEIKK